MQSEYEKTPQAKCVELKAYILNQHIFDNGYWPLATALCTTFDTISKVCGSAHEIWENQPLSVSLSLRASNYY